MDNREDEVMALHNELEKLTDDFYYLCDFVYHLWKVCGQTLEEIRKNELSPDDFELFVENLERQCDEALGRVGY